MLTPAQTEKFEQRKAAWRKKWSELHLADHPEFMLVGDMNAKRILMLLEDYAAYNHSFFPASMILFFQGHPNRHHVAQVTHYLATYYPSTEGRIYTFNATFDRLKKTTPKSILTDLKKIMVDDIALHGDLNALFSVINEKTQADYHKIKIEEKIMDVAVLDNR